MEIDTSKRFPALAVAEILFDVRENKTDAQKSSASYRIQAGETKRVWMPDADQIIEAMFPWSEFSVLFESEE
jgi:hypothetical protein